MRPQVLGIVDYENPKFVLVERSLLRVANECIGSSIREILIVTVITNWAAEASVGCRLPERSDNDVNHHDPTLDRRVRRSK